MNSLVQNWIVHWTVLLVSDSLFYLAFSFYLNRNSFSIRSIIPKKSDEELEAPIEIDDDWDDDFEVVEVSQKTSKSSKIDPPSKEELQVLKENFGYSKFRPHQWEIISNVLAGRDQLVVMATGYGKSVSIWKSWQF